MMGELEQLPARVRALEAGRPVTVVGLDGRSGVGKSTAAQWLARELGGQLVDGDSFFAGGTGLRSDPPAVRAAMCIDRPKLATVLASLRAGRATQYRPFDWDSFDGSLSAEPVTLAPAGLILLDGVYSCHPDHGDLVDLRVLLHVSDATRLRRLTAREGAIGPWERQWHEAEDWYFTMLMPPPRFDCQIDLDEGSC